MWIDSFRIWLCRPRSRHGCLRNALDCVMLIGFPERAVNIPETCQPRSRLRVTAELDEAEFAERQFVQEVGCEVMANEIVRRALVCANVIDVLHGGRQ